MKAMILRHIAPIGTYPLVPADVPEPRPGADQVRLKIRCTICRTDLHVIEGDLPQQKLPIIPGHQIVGIVDSLGPGCTRFQRGQRVGIAWLRHTCGTCSYCQAKRENLCERARFTGYHADGGYAEYALVDEDFAYPIPDAFSDVDAAPCCARNHRLPGSKKSPFASRWKTGSVWVWIFSARGTSDSPKQGMRGLCRHARGDAPRSGSPDGGAMGGRASRGDAGTSQQCDYLRPRR